MSNHHHTYLPFDGCVFISEPLYYWLYLHALITISEPGVYVHIQLYVFVIIYQYQPVVTCPILKYQYQCML